MTLEELLNIVAAQTTAVANIMVCDEGFWDIPSLKIGPRHYYHHGSYCHFAKEHGNQSACHANKMRSTKQALERRPFYGCCPFGVWDYADPVFVNDRCVAVVYLGHFQSNRPLVQIGGQDYDGPPLQLITPARIQEIRENAAFIRQFIIFAFQNAHAMGKGVRKQMPPAHYHRICIKYIKSNYHQPVSLKDLAKLLDVNVNYLGQVIKEQAGMSFRKMLNDERIDQAKVHLSSEDYPITKVAYSCGFEDSNYFSSVFRQHTGLSPTAYRNAHATPTA